MRIMLRFPATRGRTQEQDPGALSGCLHIRFQVGIPSVVGTGVIRLLHQTRKYLIIYSRLDHSLGLLSQHSSIRHGHKIYWKKSLNKTTQLRRQAKRLLSYESVGE